MYKKYSGMTVNERLFLSGKMDSFELAMKKRDATKVRMILKEIDIDDDSIEIILRDLRGE